jgi:hypothetical protein
MKSPSDGLLSGPTPILAIPTRDFFQAGLWVQAPHRSSRSDFTQVTSTLDQVSTFGPSGIRFRAVGRIAFLQ